MNKNDYYQKKPKQYKTNYGEEENNYSSKKPRFFNNKREYNNDMKIESKNRYEFRGPHNYYNNDNNKYKFSNKFYSNKQGNEAHFKELEKDQKTSQIEEMYSQNTNYNYKYKNDTSNKTEEEGEPKLMFTNSKKVNSEGGMDKFKPLSQEGDVS